MGSHRSGATSWPVPPTLSLVTLSKHSLSGSSPYSGPQAQNWNTSPHLTIGLTLRSLPQCLLRVPRSSGTFTVAGGGIYDWLSLAGGVRISRRLWSAPGDEDFDWAVGQESCHHPLQTGWGYQGSAVLGTTGHILDISSSTTP